MKQTNNLIDQAARYKPIIDYINENHPEKILEIGSWSQWIWRFININFDWLDLSKNDYQKNERETWSNMNFIYWNALDIPIKNNTYDLVFSCDMLEHIHRKDREKVLNEALRVCKKWCIVIFWFPCWFFGKMSDYFLFYSFKILHLINQKITIPTRLTEHIDIDYPSNKEVQLLLKRISKEYQLDTKKIKKYNFNNVFFHIIFIFLDMSIYMTRLFYSSWARKIHNYFMNKYLNTKLCYIKSIFPYRKYIIIKK